MKSKMIVLTIVLSLLLSGMLAAVGAEAREEKEGAAEGLEENETQGAQEIHDWHDLDGIRDNLADDYILMDDLDQDTAGYDELVDTENGWKPIGEMSFDDDLGFSGTFDGNGYEVSDLYIDRPETSSVGLFGCADDGEITDIGIVDADVNGEEYVGGLVAVTWAGTWVSNSYVTGEVNGNSQVGGLVGNSIGRVKKSYATSDVSGNMYVGGLIGDSEFPVLKSYATGDVSGDSQIGGLVGSNSGDKISNSYATGDVSGSSEVGGLVGRNWMGSVKYSYAAGKVSGDELVGGVVGKNDDGTVSNSFWDEDSTGQTEGVGESDGDFDAEGLSTSEMQGHSAEENMDDLDFENTWQTTEGDYPSLVLEEKEEQDEDSGIPGFTSTLLFLAVVVTVALYHEKKR